MKKKTYLRFALLFVLTATAFAETPLGEVAFRQSLRDIGTDLRLMCVAAHPDDEDGATLALYRKAYGLDTYAVIATHGEGGQNEIGPELYEELGVIRTDEMKAASKITGAELHFLNLPEFGYSKSIEETYAIWGKEETLRRMVRMIRLIRPDVIITHHGKQKDHGHHQAVGDALIKAFDAAADPSVFPELIDEGLQPWQAARLYIRSFTETPEALAVPIGSFDSLRGVPYTEIAAQALEEHASQGMGFFIDRFIRGQQYAWYELEKEAPGDVVGAGNLPAPDAVLLRGLKDRVSAEARNLSRKEGSLEELKPAILAAYPKHQGEADWDRLATATMQLELAATIDDPEVVPGQETVVHANLRDFGAADALSVAMSLVPDSTGTEPSPVPFDDHRDARFDFDWTVPQDEPLTLPRAEHLFDPDFLESPLHVEARVTLNDGGVLRLTIPVNVQIAAPISVGFLDSPYLVRHNVDSSTLVTLAVTNHRPDASTTNVALSAAPGLKVDAPEQVFDLPYENAEHVWGVSVGISDNPPLQPRDYRLTALADDATEAAHGVVRMVDLALPENINVGVVQSYDDTYVKTLRKMGVPHRILSEKDFNAAVLDTFSTIVIDIRAYLVRPDLVANNQALLDYVHRGGTLIVNYQKTFEWKPEYAPYPIRLSRNRVTDKNAAVTLLNPEDPLFHVPNAIGARDWAGWRQERGLYFPDEWDAHYAPLIDVQDPGESIPPGSLLIASYGDGVYVYTALGWYRQLRDLHPGALRIFANMLALNR